MKFLNIQICLTISDIGAHVSDMNMGKFCFLFNHLHVNIGKIDFEDWTLQNSVLVDGIIRQAHHMILDGLFKYPSIVYPNMIVVGVQFLGQGGIALADYGLMPMVLDNVVRVIQQKFFGKKCSKFVIASYSLHRYVNKLSI